MLAGTLKSVALKASCRKGEGGKAAFHTCRKGEGGRAAVSYLDCCGDGLARLSTLLYPGSNLALGWDLHRAPRDGFPFGSLL